MKKKGYFSIPQLAEILGVSRIAVYKRVKKGEIKAIKVGRSFAIPGEYVEGILGRKLGQNEKREIDRAVRKIVKEYGELLQLLGAE